MPREIAVLRPGGYERLATREAPRRPLGPGEARVEVRAAGVNFADACVRMGVYGAVKRYPVVPGFEFSGVVAESSSPSWRAGEAVLGVARFGAYATELVVGEAQLWRKPEAWSFEQAAGFPAVFLTASHGLLNLAHVAAGERVLIHSAAGGVGLAAAQLARLRGASAVGVVGASRKVAACAAACDAVIDKSSEDLWSRAETLAPDGYDVILDPNGYQTLAESARHLAVSGRLLVYGFATMLPRGRGRVDWLRAAGAYWRTPRVDPLRLCAENKAVIGFNVVHLFHKRELLASAMRALLGWAAEGRIHPLPVTAYPFDRAADAHRAIESGGTVGKLVLLI